MYSNGKRLIPGFALALVLAQSANAAETITYAYDARGRLVQITHSGAVNNGVQKGYVHDAAGNRTRVLVTGAATSGTP